MQISRISTALLQWSDNCLLGESCLDTSSSSYLDSGFGEVDSACKVFPYKGIRVVCSLKDPL